MCLLTKLAGEPSSVPHTLGVSGALVGPRHDHRPPTSSHNTLVDGATVVGQPLGIQLSITQHITDITKDI